MNTDGSWRTIYLIGGIAALVALIVVLVGTAVYLASNAALPMLDLANRYSIAGSDSERRALEAAGLALLARGAHGSMGFFLGLFLSSLGTLLMSFVVLLGRVFSRITGWVGLVGIGLLMVYTIVFTFVPEPGAAMMVFAMPGGLLMLVWNVLIARKLLQLGAATGA
jgi:MFS family permease